MKSIQPWMKLDYSNVQSKYYTQSEEITKFFAYSTNTSNALKKTACILGWINEVIMKVPL